MIVLALKQNELSMRELALQLGYSKLTDTVRSIINELINEGEVEYIYPTKITSPNQKIRLVKKKTNSLHAIE